VGEGPLRPRGPSQTTVCGESAWTAGPAAGSGQHPPPTWALASVHPRGGLWAAEVCPAVCPRRRGSVGIHGWPRPTGLCLVLFPVSAAGPRQGQVPRVKLVTSGARVRRAGAASVWRWSSSKASTPHPHPSSPQPHHTPSPPG
jgi:hypothetical protein